jgi:hypothetical protein
MTGLWGNAAIATLVYSRADGVRVRAGGSVPQRRARASAVTNGHQRFGGRQVIARSSQADGMLHAADSDCGPKGRGRHPWGSRWAATSVRNDRGARPKTVEEHDLRSCRRRPLTWHSSCVFPGPQPHAVPCRNARYRSRTEEARGSNPLITTPQTDPIVEVPTEIHQALVPRHTVRFRSDLLSQLAASSRPVSRGGRSTSPPHYAATPATLPDPRPPSGSASDETDITTERRSRSSDCAGADVEAAVARRLGQAGR